MDDRTRDLPGAALAPFLAIAFGLGWGVLALFALVPETVTALTGPLGATNPLFFLAVYAPAIGAMVLVLRHGGLRALAAFLGRLSLWRAPVAWYALLLVAIPAVYAAGAALAGNPAGPVRFESLGAAAAAVAGMAALGPVEEIGWRGLALPLLQRRRAPVSAGAVLGLIWGLWHLPAFLLSGTPQAAWSFGPFLAGSVAVSVILAGLFNASGGSILLAMLFHFQLNNPFWPDAQPWDMALFCALAVAVVALDRERMLARGAGSGAVIPSGCGAIGTLPPPPAAMR